MPALYVHISARAPAGSRGRDSENLRLPGTVLNVTCSRGKEEQGSLPRQAEGASRTGDAQGVAGAARTAVPCLNAA